jgi:TolB protein
MILTLAGFFKVIDHSRLPSLLKKGRIPDPASLREWTSNGAEILLAGEVLLNSNSNLILKFHLFDLVEQKHLVGKQYEGSSQILRKMVHRIADEIVLQLTGEKGVHNTKIAFVSVQGGGKEISVSDFDGAEMKRITQNQSINISPAWSPDGKKIVFTSYLRRNPDLYLVDVDGQNFRRLTSYPGLNAAPHGPRMEKRWRS